MRKKKEEIVIAILLIITVALVVLGINLRRNSNEQVAIVEETNKNLENNEEETKVSLEENIVYLKDGTKYNMSEALKEEKEIDGLKLTDIQLTEKEGKTILLGTLENPTNVEKGDYWANVTLLDKENKEIIVLPTYISKLEAGQRIQFNTQATLDYANAYDFKIAKQ